MIEPVPEVIVRRVQHYTEPAIEILWGDGERTEWFTGDEDTLATALNAIDRLVRIAAATARHNLRNWRDISEIGKSGVCVELASPKNENGDS